MTKPKSDKKWEDKLFTILLKFSNSVAPEREYRFHCPKEGEKQRKWRFDFAYPEQKIAFEVEGGTWMGGRHVHPIGFEKDCEKYNMAVKQDWHVYRLTPKMINLEYLEALLF